MAAAWEQDGVFGQADAAFATFAVLTRDVTADDQHRPVWVVWFKGTCVPLMGPITRTHTPGECAGTEWNVIVDATTLEALSGYGGGGPPGSG